MSLRFDLAADRLVKKPELRSLCGRLRDLFFVTDYYAVQTPRSFYPSYAMKGYPTLDETVILLALDGAISIGVYTTQPQTNVCKFLAIDFDAGDVNDSNRYEKLKGLQPKVLTVEKRLKDLGLTCYKEYSGNKGYHIFCFFDRALPSYMAYDIAHYAIDPVDRKIETFPKQRSLDTTGKGIGSQIRLPLCINKKSSMKSRWVDDNFEPIPQQFYFTRALKTTPSYIIEKAAKIAFAYLEKHKPKPIEISASEAFDPFDIKITGPNQRNEKEFAFVMRCKNSGWTKAEARIAGKKWLHSYKEMFESDLGYAFFKLENTLKRIYGGELWD